METSVKSKNIFILLFTYLLGFFSCFIVLNTEKESILLLLNSINKEKVVTGIVTLEPEYEEEVLPVTIIASDDICPIRVDINGAVNKPGVYCFDNDSAVVDAVKKAGGFTNLAAFKYLAMRVNLANLMQDNTKIYIPYEQDQYCEVVNFTLPKEITNITEPVLPSDDPNDSPVCVNINGSDSNLLQTLNGVGPSTAQKIIDGRPYTKLEDLLNISGIGQATYDKFKDDICL
jgi:competence ComEA-like helix-hairpin-helix protein